LSKSFPKLSDPACRIIVDSAPASGLWNMAVDEALLESVVAEGPATVRWYRWERATVSLGYFQAEEAAHREPRLAGLPVVRRLSGGGAIVHHHELTYSCTLPAWHVLAADARQLYTVVHDRIVEVLTEIGFKAARRGTSDPDRGNEFLCFGRKDDFDVVMQGHKVLGSAQRRRKGAVLQHGSLVLRRSEWAPEYPGVFDCAGYSVSETELLERLSRALGGVFSNRQDFGLLALDERDRAASIAQGHADRQLRNIELGVRDSV